MTPSLRSERATKRRESLAGLSRRIFALALAGIFVVASVAAGSTYLWCIPMQRAMSSSCVAAIDAEEEPGGDGLPSLHSQCCDRQLIGHLPPGRAADGPTSVGAPAILPSREVAIVGSRPAARSQAAPAPAEGRRNRSIRAGPRTASERCAALQVFLC